MKIIDSISGRAVAISGDNIDTDQLVPARYLKEITFANMGRYLFYDQRFDEFGKQKKHPLNDPRFQGASIMVVNKNFGCGSSREHAPQALKRFGIQAVIGESFAEIFSGNCLAIGIPLIPLPQDLIQKIMTKIESLPATVFKIDIANQTVRFEDIAIGFNMPSDRRQQFLDGSWDMILVLKTYQRHIAMVEKNLPYSFAA